MPHLLETMLVIEGIDSAIYSKVGKDEEFFYIFLIMGNIKQKIFSTELQFHII